MGDRRYGGREEAADGVEYGHRVAYLRHHSEAEGRPHHARAPGPGGALHQADIEARARRPLPERHASVPHRRHLVQHPRHGSGFGLRDLRPRLQRPRGPGPPGDAAAVVVLRRPDDPHHDDAARRQVAPPGQPQVHSQRGRGSVALGGGGHGLHLPLRSHPHIRHDRGYARVLAPARSPCAPRQRGPRGGAGGESGRAWGGVRPRQECDERLRGSRAHGGEPKRLGLRRGRLVPHRRLRRSGR
mmetsp:Transcript_56561/g.183886  ORF Transcript_56561/g.183886 Transcript_56561/m.183886 type:complete len:243 (-) Transcript_56561:1898-2626(-)